MSAVADAPVTVVCAGRTDAGVHAAGQVAHFDAPVARRLAAWVYGANDHLPSDIAVLWAQAVPEAFHARHSALARRYRYTILNRDARPALDARRAWWVRKPLDAARMQHAAQFLPGEHDFSAFRAAACQSRTPIRRVDAVAVTRAGDVVWIDIEANAFLHHMVRNIAGSLVVIGRGLEEPDWMRRLLEGRDRTRAGMTAPPDGLVLEQVRYPERFGLAGGGCVVGLAGLFQQAVSGRPHGDDLSGKS